MMGVAATTASKCWNRDVQMFEPVVAFSTRIQGEAVTSDGGGYIFCYNYRWILLRPTSKFATYIHGGVATRDDIDGIWLQTSSDFAMTNEIF